MGAQRVVSVVHGQVVWKPHVCVICALFSWVKTIAAVHQSPFPAPTLEIHMQDSFALEPNKPRRMVRVFNLKIIHYCQTALSSKQALRTPPVLLYEIGRSPG